METEHTPPARKAFIQAITDKQWFADDESLTLVTEETHIGDGLYMWTTETYLPICSIEHAQEDPDVIVGDFHPNEDNRDTMPDKPGIYLYQSESFMNGNATTEA